MFTFASTFHKAFMKDTSCGSSSVGRALASQAKGRGFESHLPLPKNKTLIIISIYPSKHDKERSNQNF